MTLLLYLSLTNALLSQQVADSQAPWEVLVLGRASIAVPRGWRNLDGLRPNTLVFRQGDGSVIPPLDDTGQPLQAGLVVEQRRDSGSLREIARELVSGVQRDPRLRPLYTPSIDPVRLSDSTDAVLVTAVFVKDDQRQSLQFKLVARSSDAQTWVVSGFLVGGKGSRWCRAESDLGDWVRAHVLSLTFNASRSQSSDLREAYRRIAEQ